MIKSLFTAVSGYLGGVLSIAVDGYLQLIGQNKARAVTSDAYLFKAGLDSLLAFNMRMQSRQITANGSEYLLDGVSVGASSQSAILSLSSSMASSYDLLMLGTVSDNAPNTEISNSAQIAKTSDKNAEISVVSETAGASINDN
jgi:hypothetical protein